jgi:tRNA (guanosine-2'-O-)-methyltransferase
MSSHHERLYQLLSEHLSERKRQLFDEVASHRTRHLTVVLEDLYQAQNVSAIQRTVESWGVQDMYVIENEHSFNHHRRVSKGANDWLTLHRYNEKKQNTEVCFEDLRSKGYQVVVTALHEKSIPLQEVDITKRTAVVMGTELSGASMLAIKNADVLMHIPTYGFTESLNVGAACAVIVQNLIERMRSEEVGWELSDKEMLDLKIAWAKKSIYWSKYIVDMFESGELEGSKNHE